MKNILFLVVFLLTAIAGFSQKRKQLQRVNTLKLEQRNTLAVKKLTLQLDLNQRQSKRVKALLKEVSNQRMTRQLAARKMRLQQREKRIALRKESKDVADFRRKAQREIANQHQNGQLARKIKRRRLATSFEAKNIALDHMIAMRKGMKTILTEAQFTRYKKLQLRRMRVAKNNMKKVKMAKRLKHARR